MKKTAIVLLGTCATGKSTIANYFKKRNWKHIDVDSFQERGKSYNSTKHTTNRINKSLKEAIKSDQNLIYDMNIVKNSYLKIINKKLSEKYDVKTIKLCVSFFENIKRNKKRKTKTIKLRNMLGSYFSSLFVNADYKIKNKNKMKTIKEIKKMIRK